MTCFGPFSSVFGFTPLPPVFFVILAVLVVIYLGLVEVGKSLFFRMESSRAPAPLPPRRARLVSRRRSSWAHGPADFGGW